MKPSRYCKGKPHPRHELLPLAQEGVKLVGTCKVCQGRKVYPPPTFEGTFNGSLESNPAIEAMWR